MALCELKSEDVIPPAEIGNEDLEDGEIEDDEDEEVPSTEAPQPEPVIPAATVVLPQANGGNKLLIEKPPPPVVEQKQQQQQQQQQQQPHEKYDRQKVDRRSKHEDGKKKGHLTEAEKSVMFLHKLERMEREKRDKYRREPGSAGGVEQPFPNFTHHHFNKFAVDDFASSIEKQIASVLKKERTISDEDKDEDKRGRKRKKKERDRRKQKQRKMDSPKSEEIDDADMTNMHGGSPDQMPHHHGKDTLPKSEESHSEDSDEVQSDRSNEERRERRRERRDRRSKNRERNRERREMNREKKGQQQQQMQQMQQQQHQHQPDIQQKDAQHLCVYYLQGKCQKGDECPYSHDSQPPMKWELCKFYLNDCCAKGDKCLYMHSDFPCKFYHTGQPCLEGENCKFAHGKPLSDRLKQILFKHIETAPKDILGRFPRMSRDEAIFKINQTQMGLETLYGGARQDDENIPSLFDLSIPLPMEFGGDTKGGDKEKPNRNRPSRWQESEMMDKGLFKDQRKPPNFNKMAFPPGQDLDMRLPSNGDIDMRTLQMSIPPPTMLPPPMLGPPNMSVPPPNMMMMMPPRLEDSRPVDIDQYKREATKMDVDIRNLRGDTDIRNLDPPRGDTDSRQMDFFNKRDVDNRQPLPPPANNNANQCQTDDDEAEPKLHIVCDEEPEKTEDNEEDIPASLPKRQRELFMRIQAQQKENLLENQAEKSDAEENAIDWYSDDSNEGRLTIKCDEDVVKEKEDEEKGGPTSPVKPSEFMQKLGDLSKITITEEVSKLLSSLSGGSPSTKEKPRDPRQATSVGTLEDNKPARPDPRKARIPSTEAKPKEKLSIYEQGYIAASPSGKDVDLRSVDTDSDLRPDFGDLDLRNSRPDIDLRQLGLPFKAMQNYQPATEIDASYSSHLPIIWTVHIVDIPKPDYTGLKLSAQEAQTTGDPRLRKIFRLDLDEKDSPASPKQSPKATTTSVRVDPRIRKAEEQKSSDPTVMSYAQQMNMLQGSLFYQNLTSNQKVKLNQELAIREPTTGANNEQILVGILSTLGLIQNQGPANMSGTVLSLLSTISSMAQMGLNPNMQQNPVGIMGGVPGIMQNPGMGIAQNPMMGQQVNPNILQQNPNMGNMGGNHEFPINFDPRNGGLLGNAPPFVNFPPENQSFNNFNSEDNFYPENSGGNFNGNRDNRFNNRDNRGGGRRGRNFGRNRNNNFRNRNRANRGHAAS